MIEPTSEPDVTMEMFSQAKLLSAARAMVGSVAQRLGFDEIQCGQISLAVDEALCNVINHGYNREPNHRIWLKLWDMRTDPPGIHIVIEDRAKQVNPEQIRSRDLDDVRPGGLGVYIIREIMDVVQYEKREGGGMKLTLSKQVKSESDGQVSTAAERTGEG